MKKIIFSSLIILGLTGAVAAQTTTEQKTTTVTGPHKHKHKTTHHKKHPTHMAKGTGKKTTMVQQEPPKAATTKTKTITTRQR